MNEISALGLGPIYGTCIHANARAKVGKADVERAGMGLLSSPISAVGVDIGIVRTIGDVEDDSCIGNKFSF
jgi:hypothetical protein